MEGEDAIFSWFKRAKPVEDTTGRLDRLENNMEHLEKTMRRLQEEWTEVYHKFRVLQMRVAKQVQRLDANSSQEAGKSDGEAEPAVVAAGSSLSPRMQRIQKEILERRQRRAAPVAKEGGE